jgi:hypothetical protein
LPLLRERKVGKVRETKNDEGKVRDKSKSQGKVREFVWSRKIAFATRNLTSLSRPV